MTEPILVTGGAGYIGSHTCHQLVDAGQNVVCLDNLYSGHPWAVPEGATFVEGSAGDSRLVESLIIKHQIQSVIHFAGHIEVEESIHNPLKYYGNNTAVTHSLLSACLHGGVRNFIFSSTAAVYGNSGDRPISETAPPAPMNPYGRSKLMIETMLSDLAASASETFRFIALRYFNVAGARADLKIGQATPNTSHLIKVACQTALGIRPKTQIFGTDYPTPDGTGIRDYIHVEDLASAHLSALKYLENGGSSRILNCGYGKGYSVREVLEMIRKVSGQNFPIEESQRRPGDPACVVADPTQIKKVLSWSPRFDDLETICKTAFAWEKKWHSACS